MAIKLWHAIDSSSWVKKIFDNIDYDRCEKIEDCDYILIPNTFISNYHDQNLAWLKNIHQESMNTGKPYIAFLHDDPTGEMIQDGVDYTENGILFRTSFYKSSASKNEYSLPSFDKEGGVYIQLTPKVF